MAFPLLVYRKLPLFTTEVQWRISDLGFRTAESHEGVTRRAPRGQTLRFSDCEIGILLRDTAMLDKLRGLGKFSEIRNISDSDIPPAKAPRTLSWDKYLFLFAAFASLREIIRNSGAASLHWALCG